MSFRGMLKGYRVGMPVKTEKLYKTGEYIDLDPNGLLITPVDAGGAAFAGVVAETKKVAAGKPLLVLRDAVGWAPNTGSFTQKEVGDKVFATDATTLKKTGTRTKSAGRLIAVKDGEILVDFGHAEQT